MKTPAANKSEKTPAAALAKITVLTGLFEKLVAEAGSRRRRIEQLLAELGDEAPPAAPDEPVRRAA